MIYNVSTHKVWVKHKIVQMNYDIMLSKNGSYHSPIAIYEDIISYAFLYDLGFHSMHLLAIVLLGLKTPIIILKRTALSQQIDRYIF